ncbi:MAG: amidohydrolase family protein [Balneolales bacterium]
MKLIASLIFILCYSITIGYSSDNGYSREISYTYLIKGGTVIDGTGSKGFKADILIKDDHIKFIGKVDTGEIEIDRIIDATGKVVTPGFIDTHAHGNPLSTPGFPNFLSMGVTTINLGQDGSSPRVGDTKGWMKDVEEVRPGVNIIHFIGHGSIRRAAGVNERSNVTAEELQKMISYVEEALSAGSFGMSTGLEYIPGTFVGMEELVALTEPIGKKGGMVMSHIRNEDDSYIEESITELIEQGRRSATPIHISHIKIVYGNDETRVEEILDLLQDTRTNGQIVTADIYPYTASYTGIGIIFPDWAKAPFNYREVVTTRREELATYLRDRVAMRNGPEATLFGTQPYAGKTLAQVAKEKGKSFEDVLIDDIGPTGAGAAYFVMSEKVMARFLSNSNVMISSDGSPTMHHPRGYGSFAKIIRKYVVEEKLLTLEEAIHKMTGLPASTLGINKTRGYLKSDLAADLLIFDPVWVQDRADYENPHTLAEGFDYVMVNGQLVIDNGNFIHVGSGKMLKRQDN